MSPTSEQSAIFSLSFAVFCTLLELTPCFFSVSLIPVFRLLSYHFPHLSHTVIVFECHGRQSKFADTWGTKVVGATSSELSSSQHLLTHSFLSHLSCFTSPFHRDYVHGLESRTRSGSACASPVVLAPLNLCSKLSFHKSLVFAAHLTDASAVRIVRSLSDYHIT